VLCLFRGALGTRLIQCGLRRGLLPSSSIEPFGHNSVGCHSPRRNITTNYYLVVEIGERATGSPSNTKSPGPRPSSIRSGSLMHQPFRHNRNGPKILGGGLRPFWGRGLAGSPSNTKSPGLRPTSMPSTSFIHPAVWPQ